MTLTVILEIAVGLAFVYLVVAMAASAGQELLATLLNVRSANLMDGIQTLLASSPGAPGGALAWLGSLLRVGVPKAAGGATQAEADLINHVCNHPLVKPMGPDSKPSYVASGNFALALLDGLQLQDGSELPLLSQVENTIVALPPGAARAALETFVRNAGGDPDKLRAAFASWFDDAMDRLSGAYKLWVHRITFVIGLLLAAALNIDSLDIIDTMAVHATTRQETAAGVRAYLKDHPEPPSAGDISTLLQVFGSLPLPVGRSDWPWVSAQKAFANPDPLHAVVLPLIGWLITAAAAALGAPVWFELLASLVNPRGAGPKPERAASAAGS
jgi:hypothetical protein